MSRRARCLLVAVLVGLVALAGCGGRADRHPSSSTSTQHLVLDGVRRDYRLHVPAGPAPTGRAGRPLVVVLHGGFGSGSQAEKAYGWDEVADREGFLVAYPDGWRRAWNTDGGCCGRSASRGIDDVGFLEEVVRRIRADHDVDPARIFLTGMSNGAMMSYTMACRSTTFAAIAPVAGTQLVDCPGAAPVSVLHVHGLADDRVRFDGGRGEGTAHVDGPPVEQVISGWRAIDHCATPTVASSGDVHTSTSTCAGGRTVTLVTVDGAGHQWPGSSGGGPGRLLGADRPSDAFDATALIWRFFAAHPGSR